MEEVYKDINYKTPLVFILSQGADVFILINKLISL